MIVMNETVNFIFRNLRQHDVGLENLAKAVNNMSKNLNNTNKSIAKLAFATTSCFIFAYMLDCQSRKEIARLEQRISELEKEEL